MADKIVQLIDKDGNNVYPVAGSLAQDSVTTSSINDGAVTASKLADGAITSDKIDYTTLKRWVPDYSQKSGTNLFASKDTATMTNTGFVYYELNYWATTAQNVSLRINNKLVAKGVSLRDVNNNYVAATSGIMTVSAGDVVTINKGSSMSPNAKELYFIPGKWV